MSATLLTKSEYAVHRGVTQAAVTNWLKRGKLTAPALLPDGKIDAQLADEQLPAVVRRRPPRPRRRRVIRRDVASEASGDPPGGQPSVVVDDAEAADRQHAGGRPPGARHDRKPIGAFVVVDELPGLAQKLRLDKGQVSALNRWFLGRCAA